MKRTCLLCSGHLAQLFSDGGYDAAMFGPTMSRNGLSGVTELDSTEAPSSHVQDMG